MTLWSEEVGGPEDGIYVPSDPADPSAVKTFYDYYPYSRAKWWIDASGNWFKQSVFKNLWGGYQWSWPASKVDVSSLDSVVYDQGGTPYTQESAKETGATETVQGKTEEIVEAAKPWGAAVLLIAGIIGVGYLVGGIAKLRG